VSIFEKWRDLARISAYREPWWDEIEARNCEPETEIERLAVANRMASLGDYDADIEAEVALLSRKDVGTYSLYVGTSRHPGAEHRELDRALVALLESSHEGFTIVRGEGYWQGDREGSYTVTISDTEDSVRETAALIRIALNQACVGLVRIGGEMVMV
jgi:hypothetical protein